MPCRVRALLCVVHLLIAYGISVGAVPEVPGMLIGALGVYAAVVWREEGGAR